MTVSVSVGGGLGSLLLQTLYSLLTDADHLITCLHVFCSIRRRISWTSCFIFTDDQDEKKKGQSQYNRESFYSSLVSGHLVWIKFQLQTCPQRPKVKVICLSMLHSKGLKSGTSLVGQWLRIHLPMQGTWVPPPAREDYLCCEATKPVHPNY